MFNIENVKEMIELKVFSHSNFDAEEVEMLVRHLNNAFDSHNNTMTIKGKSCHYSDFKSELFLVSTYEEISYIDISLYIYSEIYITLKNGNIYLLSDYCDYYMDAGVTLIEKGSL